MIYSFLQQRGTGVMQKRRTAINRVAEAKLGQQEEQLDDVLLFLFPNFPGNRGIFFPLM